MKFYFLSSLIFFQLSLNAQITFKKQFPMPLHTFASTVLQTYDHGYILMSLVDVGSYRYNTCLIKTNETGDTLWSKMYAYGKNGYTRLGMVQCPDSGFAVLGEKNGVYLLRLTKNGDSLWGKELGSGSAFSIEISQNNEFIISGIDSTLLFLRANYNGEILSHKNISILPPGYTTGQFGFSIKPTNDNGSIIGGTSDWISNSYPFLAKTDYYGNLQWAKSFTYLEESGGCSLDITKDSGFILAGYSSGGALIIKTNFLGDTLWVNTYQSRMSPSYYSVTTCNVGDYIACGRTGDNLSWMEHILLTKTSQDGSLIWSKNLCSDTMHIEGVCVKETYDGGFIILGDIHIDYPPFYDLILIKTDESGNVSWVKPVYNAPMFSVYPNPADKYITIETRKTTRDATIEVFDLTGKCRLKTKSESSKNVVTISVDSLEPGEYLLKISTDNNVYWTKKIIKL